jgi:hypothetical protein
MLDDEPGPVSGHDPAEELRIVEMLGFDRPGDQQKLAGDGKPLDVAAMRVLLWPVIRMMQERKLRALMIDRVGGKVEMIIARENSHAR